MDGRGEVYRETTPRMTAAALFLLAALTATVTFLNVPGGLSNMSSGHIASDVAAVLSPLVFLCACVLVFVRPTLGYRLGLAAGLMLFPWFIWMELGFYENSWVWLNLVPGSREEGTFQTFAKLRIVSLPFIVMALVCSLVRLTPAQWVIKNSPMRGWTWPAPVAALLVMVGWFAHSVTPYRVPYIVDGPDVDLRILHVQKRGLQFRETEVTATRNGGAFVLRNDRRLFQYQFSRQVARVSLGESPRLLDQARAVMSSPELWRQHTAPANTFRSWNAEGWYITLRDSHLLAFTSESHTAPPQDVANLFHEIEQLPGKEQTAQVRDVCLGFCFDPVAALGFWYSNEAGFARLRRRR